VCTGIVPPKCAGYNDEMRWTIFAVVGISIAFVLGFYLGKTFGVPVPGVVAISENAVSTSTSVVGYEWYPVVKVVDGDTLVIEIDGKNVTLRLIGLDTPETVDPRKPVQCFGKEASEKAKQILTGTSVRIEMDPSQGELDKYGRLLAYVYVPADVRPEGILVNEYMIAEGYGHEYTYNLPYKYQAEFKAAERKAREEKKGLWADGACADDANTSTKTGPAVPPPATAGGGYECSRNAYNCSDFKTQTEAQSAFESCGGSSNDVHKLDSDGDGKVCEGLP